MDLLVTIPKSETGNQVKEDVVVSQFKDAVVQFWKVPKKPTKLNVGDRVYFIEQGFITCYHIFKGYIQDPVCAVTGRVWFGLNLLLACPPVYLKTPIPHRGFQGFHYTDRIE